MTNQKEQKDWFFIKESVLFSFMFLIMLIVIVINLWFTFENRNDNKARSVNALILCSWAEHEGGSTEKGASHIDQRIIQSCHKHKDRWYRNLNLK